MYNTVFLNAIPTFVIDCTIVTGRKEHYNCLFYVKRAKSSIDFRAVIFYKY